MLYSQLPAWEKSYVMVAAITLKLRSLSIAFVLMYTSVCLAFSS